MSRNAHVLRDLAGLVFAVLGGLALIAVVVGLASGGHWALLGLLVGGVILLGIGYHLGHYDPVVIEVDDEPVDAIEIRPREK